MDLLFITVKMNITFAWNGFHLQLIDEISRCGAVPFFFPIMWLVPIEHPCYVHRNSPLHTVAYVCVCVCTWMMLPSKDIFEMSLGARTELDWLQRILARVIPLAFGHFIRLRDISRLMFSLRSLGVIIQTLILFQEEHLHLWKFHIVPSLIS